MVYNELLNMVFLLNAVFIIKHFMADYPLQTPQMLNKGNVENWFLPLFSHASVHASLTLLIVLWYTPSLWWLAIFDLVTHFVIDRIKSSDKYFGSYQMNDKRFWWALGVDQMLHGLVHLTIVVVMLHELF